MYTSSSAPRATRAASRPGLARRRLLAIGTGVGLAAAVAPSSIRASHATTTVNASDYGFDPVDATAALQAALDSTADVVVIDDVGEDWITRPLFLRRSNVTVVLEPGVTVRAKVGGFPGAGDCLLTIDNQEYVTILGHGARMVMNYSEYTTGEWRMCLSMRSVRHVLVDGLTLTDSGGDGIYLGVSAVPTAPRHNLDVTLRNVVSDHHRRNALSVISVDGLLVEGCAFTRAVGISPRSGIDFEPNNPNERLANVVVRDCVLTGNSSCQLVFALTRLDATSAPVSILVERVVCDDQTGGSPVVMYNGSGDADPGGTIEIRDSLIRNTRGTGNLGLFRHAGSGAHLTVRRCVIWNWGIGTGVYRPITLAAGSGSGSSPIVSYGGLTLDDCVLVTDQASPMINAIEPTGSSLTNVHGSLAVVGPAVVTTNYGASPVDVDPTVTAVAATANTGALGATVTVSPASATVSPGSPATFTFTRSGGLTARPMAVRYALGGTAQQRTDYSGLSGVVVFAAGATSATVTVTPLATAAVGATVVPSITATSFYN